MFPLSLIAVLVLVTDLTLRSISHVWQAYAWTRLVLMVYSMS
jgi:hypothetical protein